MIEAFNLNMIWAAVAAALVVLAVGPFLIPELHKLKFGQSIREEGPKSHQAKSGSAGESSCSPGEDDQSEYA